VENVLNAIAPNGLLLTLDWQVASPMLYAQEIEQRRRDVKVVDINLLRRSWYFDYLKHAYPGLIERSRDRLTPSSRISKSGNTILQLLPTARRLLKGSLRHSRR
jgi:hypothetical protein